MPYDLLKSSFKPQKEETKGKILYIPLSIPHLLLRASAYIIKDENGCQSRASTCPTRCCFVGD
jgi:hypothetical protein